MFHWRGAGGNVRGEEPLPILGADGDDEGGVRPFGLPAGEGHPVGGTGAHMPGNGFAKRCRRAARETFRGPLSGDGLMEPD